MVCAMHRLFQSEEDDQFMEGVVFPGEDIGMFEELKARAQLEGILMGLAGSLLMVSRLNKDFKERLMERNGITEIRTRDHAVAWDFTVSRGRLTARRGPHPSPDYEMVYQDIPTAVAILSDGSEEATMQAMMEGTLTFHGDLEFGMWFNERLQALGALIKEKQKSMAWLRPGK